MTGELGLLGVPSSAAAHGPGQEKAPAALRRAELPERLAAAGVGVADYGDLPVVRGRPGTRLTGGGVGGQPDLAVRPAVGGPAGGAGRQRRPRLVVGRPGRLGIAGLAAVEGVRTWRGESLADTCCD